MTETYVEQWWKKFIQGYLAEMGKCLYEQLMQGWEPKDNWKLPAKCQAEGCEKLARWDTGMCQEHS
jgi:hypothetical protein